MTFLRFLMLLSLVVWIGGLIFFAFVVAPTVFHPGILPTRQLAGNVVNRSLGILHGIGLVCGIVFAITSMVDSRLLTGVAQPLVGLVGGAQSVLVDSGEKNAANPDCARGGHHGAEQPAALGAAGKTGEGDRPLG